MKFIHILKLIKKDSVENVFIHIELDVLNLNMIKPGDVKLESIKVKKKHTKKTAYAVFFKSSV